MRGRQVSPPRATHLQQSEMPQRQRGVFLADAAELGHCFHEQPLLLGLESEGEELPHGRTVRIVERGRCALYG